MPTYKMVQIPPDVIVAAKSVLGRAPASHEVAAAYLEAIVNDMAARGWEFEGIESFGVVSSPGCVSGLFGASGSVTSHYVATFRPSETADLGIRACPQAPPSSAASTPGATGVAAPPDPASASVHSAAPVARASGAPEGPSAQWPTVATDARLATADPVAGRSAETPEPAPTSFRELVLRRPAVAVAGLAVVAVAVAIVLVRLARSGLDAPSDGQAATASAGVGNTGAADWPSQTGTSVAPGGAAEPMAQTAMESCTPPPGDPQSVATVGYGLVTSDPSRSICLSRIAAARAESEGNRFVLGAAHYNIGLAFERLGRPREAYGAYRTSLCKRPTWSRRPEVIATVRDACVRLGLGPCDSTCPGVAPAGGQGLVRDVTDFVVSEVVASSFLSERHPPRHAFDGLPTTAWNEGASGPGVGEWIEARLSRPVRVAHLTVTPGWDRISPRSGRDLFTANRYMTRFDVEHDGGTRSFDVPSGVRLFHADLGGVVTSRIRIVARAVQTGPVVYEDLCISEIRIFGEAVR